MTEGEDSSRTEGSESDARDDGTSMTRGVERIGRGGGGGGKIPKPSHEISEIFSDISHEIFEISARPAGSAAGGGSGGGSGGSGGGGVRGCGGGGVIGRGG